eukprot:CAMPEP_0184494448 /NCGR_PEP_ID=MMETSP0113_2-20130426/28718_1 /TAXON_ID=91329 /ORGANISM="Norrisiella sphaerica, Strain BC52" /LENGTH=832 /DNA_ID=CAMNT_0026880203 /DNA_START=185 /DNA_END=2680 /DNA_ORIENTATION=+
MKVPKWLRCTVGCGKSLSGKGRRRYGSIDGKGYSKPEKVAVRKDCSSLMREICQHQGKLLGVVSLGVMLVLVLATSIMISLGSGEYPSEGGSPNIPNPQWPKPPPIKRTGTEGSTGPLSDLDPVEDLGMTPIQRVGTALPVKHLWGQIKTPYPTHEFYENIVLGSGTNPENVITVLPYIVQVKGNSVSAIEPFVTASEAQVQQIFDGVMGLVSLSGKNMGYQRIVRADKLSVTIGWVAEEGALMQTTLVQGDPFLSMQYTNAQPRIVSPQTMNKLVFDGEPVHLPCKSGSVYEVNNMEIGFIQHDSLWQGYAYPKINLRCGEGGQLDLESTDAKYNGVIRLALANNCTHGSGLHCQHKGKGGRPGPPGWKEMLDEYSNKIILGGNVDHKVESERANIMLNYNIMDLIDGGTGGDALMLLLPHHRDAIDTEDYNKAPDLSPVCVQRVMLGCMTPATIIDTLQLALQLPDFLWHPPKDVPPKYLDAVKKAVHDDSMKFKMPGNYESGAGDPYNAGKLLSRMGRVALIADEMGMIEERNHMLAQLANYTSLWLSGKTQNQLVYDKNWGGMVSCGCIYDDCGGKCKPHCDNGGPPVCPSLAEGSFAAGMDFGNGYYNDHHFHYGYLLYAAAVVAKFLPEWGREYKEFILLLVRDVANPSEDDTSFPPYRHMDFYVGHSWAGGIFQPFLNGRNQESVSEAVNCWYALSVLGDALEDQRVKDIGLSLLAMEVHAAHHYWQLHRSHSPTLPDDFTKRGVSGILWSNLIQYQTWFGSTTWELNGIQMLPFTPISEFLLPAQWVNQQITDFSHSCSGQCIQDGWISLVCMAQAIVDVPGAW